MQQIEEKKKSVTLSRNLSQPEKQQQQQDRT